MIYSILNENNISDNKFILVWSESWKTMELEQHISEIIIIIF